MIGMMMMMRKVSRWHIYDGLTDPRGKNIRIRIKTRLGNITKRSDRIGSDLGLLVSNEFCRIGGKKKILTD